MKRKILSLLMATLILTSLSACKMNSTKVKNWTADIKADPVENEEEKLNETNNKTYLDLGLRLFKAGTSDEDNSLISPLSIYSALALVENAAQGQSLDEFEKTFGLSVDETNAYLKALVDQLEKEDEDAFKLANSLWLNESESLQPSEEYLKTIKTYYDSEVFSLAFDDQGEKAINKWISEKTDQMIKKGLDQIDPAARAYLFNALAFNKKWEEPYKKRQLGTNTFTKEDGTEVEGDYLFKTLDGYIEGDRETGFRQNYQGGKYSFVALLPKEDISLSAYIADLNTDRLYELLKEESYVEVKTALPKFESSYDLKLIEVLKSLGIETVFSDESDLSKLGDRGLYISDAFHKTYIKVDETGTKAAALTGMQVNKAALPVDEKEVYLTRPFVYMIVDNETDLPIFMGTVMDISQKSASYEGQVARGEKFPDENLQVYLGQDQNPVSLNKDQEVEIMDQLAKLKKSDSKDFFKSAYDDDTIVIKFSEDSYLEMIESKPARKDGLYYYNYFKDGELSALLTGQENIRENIRAIIER